MGEVGVGVGRIALRGGIEGVCGEFVGEIGDG